MFGSGKRIEKLERELAEVRGELSSLQTELTRVRPILSDLKHLERIRSDLERIRLAAEAASEGLRAQPNVESLHQARRKVPLDSVQLAKTTGYVSIYFDGGRTDVVRLLVGSTEPPDDCVCEANSTNDINSYAGGIVRAGEYWRAQSKVGASRSGFICWFTPLY
jgi:hypothetical protein